MAEVWVGADSTTWTVEHLSTLCFCVYFPSLWLRRED
jgi:hypothetical protein